MSTARKMIILFFAVVVLVAGVAGVNLLRNRTPASGDPKKLFYSALERNLSEKAVTCDVGKEASGTSQNLKVQLDLASKVNAHSSLTVTTDQSTVQTEEIVTNDGDFLRYTKVTPNPKYKGAKGPDFSKVVNKWIKPDQNNTTLFGSTALGGCVVPLAELTLRDVGTVSPLIEKGEAFKADFAHIGTTTVKGEPMRQYNVTIQPVPYVQLMQAVSKAYGLSDLKSLNIQDYSSQQPRKAIFSVDSKTGRLMQIQFTDETRIVQFADYGKVPQFTVPTKTITNKEAGQLVGQ